MVALEATKETVSLRKLLMEFGVIARLLILRYYTVIIVGLFLNPKNKGIIGKTSILKESIT